VPKRITCSSLLIAALFVFTVAETARGQDSPPAAATSAQPAASSPCPVPSPPSTSHGFHCVTVTFDYDFGKTPACTATVTKGCVQQFIAFDISGGTKNPPILFPIPLPTNPVGVVHGITKTGPPIDFESGKHLISVSAMSPDGTHSRRSLCTTWITIP
jgi:hypothetical protein